MEVKFRKGEEVVIVRSAYKCNDCGQKHGKYYHEGRFLEVGLGSHGKIIKVASANKILLQLRDGREWWVHPDEINFRDRTPLIKLKRTLPGIGDIPRHPVFELTEQTPVFVVNKTVYSVGNGGVSDGESFYEQKRKSRSTRKPLEEIGDLNSLDALALDRAHSEIEVLGKIYAQDVQKRLDILKKLDGEMDVPQLIYKQVFPYLQNGNFRAKIAQLLGSKSGKVPSKKKQRKSRLTKRFEEVTRNITSEVNDLITQIEREEQESPNRSKKQKRLDNLFDYQEPEQYSGTSLLGRALNSANVVIMDGTVYDLTPFKGGRYIARADIKGEKFRIRNEGREQTNDVENRFLFELSKRVRAEALREHLSEKRIKDLLRTQDTELLAVAGQSEYKGDGFGFVKHNGSYYVYLEIPAFAIKSQFDDKYYLFDKTGIATKVSKNGKSLSYDSASGNKSGLVLIENNNHPFLHNRGGSFAKLCTGYLSLPTSGKDKGEVIAKRLRRGREMLMFGYTGYDYMSEYKLRDNGHFDQNHTTLSRLKRLKVPIIQGGSRR